MPPTISQLRSRGVVQYHKGLIMLSQVNTIFNISWKLLLTLFVLFITVFTTIDRLLWVNGEYPGDRADPKLLVKAGIHCPDNEAEARQVNRETMEYRCGIFGDSILWSLNRPRKSKELMTEYRKLYEGFRK